MNKLLSNPEIFIAMDGSVNTRFWHLFAPYMSMYENYFLPQGVAGFEQVLLDILDRFPEYAHQYTYDYIGNKIQSGSGQLVYNLGLFGLVYFLIFFNLSKKVLGLRKSVFVTGFTFLIMSTAVSIAIPLFGFLFGYLAYKSNYE